MDLFNSLFLIIILIFSAIIHEVMHGVAAEWLGDKTARYAGRITLNPLPHLDPIGSVFLPLILSLTHSPIWFAWAKPVPYNPYNLRPGHFSEAIVAGAGPFSNLVLAILSGVVIRLDILGPEANGILFIVVVMNVMLCLFNLIPIPPLDGSKVLESILPGRLAHGYAQWRRRMEYNPFFGMGFIILIILLFGGAFSGAVYTLARAIAGI